MWRQGFLLHLVDDKDGLQDACEQLLRKHFLHLVWLLPFFSCLEIPAGNRETVLQHARSTVKRPYVGLNRY